MLIRIVLIGTLTFWPFFVGYGMQPVKEKRCAVKSVVKMVHKGKDRNQIRRKCAKADVKKCSLTQVVRMAKNGLTSRKIYEKCGHGN